jgi:hypothetical protein
LRERKKREKRESLRFCVFRCASDSPSRTRPHTGTQATPPPQHSTAQHTNKTQPTTVTTTHFVCVFVWVAGRVLFVCVPCVCVDCVSVCFVCGVCGAGVCSVLLRGVCFVSFRFVCVVLRLPEPPICGCLFVSFRFVCVCVVHIWVVARKAIAIRFVAIGMCKPWVLVWFCFVSFVCLPVLRGDQNRLCRGGCQRRRRRSKE